MIFTGHSGHFSNTRRHDTALDLPHVQKHIPHPQLPVYGTLAMVSTLFFPQQPSVMKDVWPFQVHFFASVGNVLVQETPL